MQKNAEKYYIDCPMLKPRINISGYVKFVILLVFSHVLLSCEAPRSNPLDPMNEINQGTVSIDGNVQTYTMPYLPLEDVTVQWIPENAAGTIQITNKDGYFAVPNIERQNGILVFEKDGYCTDSLEIIWNQEKKITKLVGLNKLPELDSVSIYSKVWNNSPVMASSELYISTKISDADNDIDSVYVEVPDLQAGKIMEFNVTEKSYQASFTPEELNLDDLEKSIAQDFYIYVKDLTGNKFMVGSDRVSRVIKNYVNILSPANDIMVDSLPELLWEPFKAGYTFSYTLEIYTNDIAQLLVQKIANISAETVSYSLTEPLASNQYKWVVWVTDKFNNQSMSIPATFVVQ